LLFRYALDEAIACMSQTWLRPTSRPVLGIVAGVTLAVGLIAAASGVL
jgi:hypothetical protein